MTPEQLKAYDAFYNPIRDEFRRLKLSGKALAEWKFQRYMRDYLSTTKSMDRNIGRMLDYLEQNGIKDNTIVIYISNQGFYMGKHACFDK